MTSNATEGGIQDKWGALDGQGEGIGPLGIEHPNGGVGVGNEFHAQDSNTDYPHSNGDDGGNQSISGHREKQIKPNKVYIGGLPEHTRKEDLESCFGKIGNITNVELKVGYGFVEFEARESAEESVAKYHEGFFMGNKIRVELSHGGGRTAKYNGEPGACFKCGQLGHWARECPNHGQVSRRPGNDAPLIDRIQPSRDYPPRDYPPYRDDFSRYPPRDTRYYDYTTVPHPGRDFRRASPIREYPPGPPMRRDYDDYRMRGPPPARFDSRGGYYLPDDIYPPRGYGPPPGREIYDRRGAPIDRYPSYPSPVGRPRTPPGPPPRSRDDYDRPPPRDYAPPLDTRGRPGSPRYDYSTRTEVVDGSGARYRRRSQSPAPRSASAAYDPAYPSGGGPSYSGGPSGGFAGSNGYSGTSGPPRNAGSARDYFPRASRDAPDPGYRR